MKSPQITKVNLEELSILKLYEHYASLEKSIPLLVTESQDLAKAELEQCSTLRSEKIDRLYYAWSHHEDAIERAKKEQELLMSAKKHHESQITKIRGLINWLRTSAPLESNRITGKNYGFVVSRKSKLTVEFTDSVENWEPNEINEFCLEQKTTTIKEVVVTSLGGDLIEHTTTPVTKSEIIPNVDKLRSAYQEGKPLPKGVKVYQEYNIKRSRILSQERMGDFSPQSSEELLSEFEATCRS